jgi:hypothetical protein
VLDVVQMEIVELISNLKDASKNADAALIQNGSVPTTSLRYIVKVISDKLGPRAGSHVKFPHIVQLFVLIVFAAKDIE